MRRDLADCAVVLGGSMAGLLAARVLAERFATVVVVERDRLPDSCRAAAGHSAGQAHPRAAGRRAASVRAAAAGPDAATSRRTGCRSVTRWPIYGSSINGHRFRQAPSGLTLVSPGREMLEHHLRRRVRVLPNLTITDRCDVVGLAESGGRITGVRVLPRGDHSLEETLAADLVVDATGRGSRAPVWLSDLGFPPPAEEQLRVDLGYTTRRYRLPGDAVDGGLGLLQAPTPDRPRGAALARLEDGVWMLTLIGLGGDHPPGRVEDFDRFAASVGSDELTSLIRPGRADRRPRCLPVPGEHPTLLRAKRGSRRTCWWSATAWPASTPSTAKE